MPTIQVLGTGCARCGQLMNHAQQAVAHLEGNVNVEKIDDIVKILEFNPSALPALAIDGTVVAAGNLPTADEIRRLIQPTLDSEPQ